MQFDRSPVSIAALLNQVRHQISIPAANDLTFSIVNELPQIDRRARRFFDGSRAATAVPLLTNLVGNRFTTFPLKSLLVCYCASFALKHLSPVVPPARNVPPPPTRLRAMYHHLTLRLRFTYLSYQRTGQKRGYQETYYRKVADRWLCGS
jgi:hypothetical protein